mmetsp:Transcript_52656/g.104561  ORF Transcript_52656/g.104561 Transcript_52656/m.104561 type:complete len:714 (+) Transcript_52656:157-2298(+)
MASSSLSKPRANYTVVLQTLLLVEIFPDVCAQLQPVVQTTHGNVRGARLGKEGGAFYLIPYAKSPTGPLRFNQSQPRGRWRGILNVFIPPVNQTHACPQYIEGKGLVGQEDCLKLFVYSPQMPTKPSQSNLPVMFFIHGGSWYLGDGYEGGRYSGTSLAMYHGVVVVSVQYRLGPLGLLTLPELQRQDGLVGNMALVDQRHALQWVRANIAKFGGNPAKVVIFGSDVGASSVCWHLASPGSQGLFRGAILESAHCGGNTQPVTVAMQRWAWAARGAGCSGLHRLQCLSKMPIPSIMASPLYSPTMYSMVIDGTAEGLPARQLELMASGNSSSVPLILGSNKNEHEFCCGRSQPSDECPFLIGWNDDESPRRFIEGMLGQFLSDAQWSRVDEAYPTAAFPDAASRGGAMITDAGWHDRSFKRGGHAFTGQCSVLAAARAAAAGIEAKRVQGRAAHQPWIYQLDFGGQHADEVPFIFGTCSVTGQQGGAVPYPPCAGTNGDIMWLSSLLAFYWTNFAKTLDPNKGDRGNVHMVDWVSGLGSVLTIGARGKGGVRIGPPSRSVLCDFWQRLLQERDETGQAQKDGDSEGQLAQLALQATCSVSLGYRWCKKARRCIRVWDQACPVVVLRLSLPNPPQWLLIAGGMVLGLWLLGGVALAVVLLAPVGESPLVVFLAPRSGGGGDVDPGNTYRSLASSDSLSISSPRSPPGDGHRSNM